ncbi:hypothetical protein O181_109908 [Austropuccinia psidii MF-1]|uniref:Uncharacterized protein n=1 Tax=Austropuccinia psidii MF-1 TaxID=1389203 RepID=A0A9Q3JWT5_9BASI|nr:hypothetical protein [Austropuccinia psidii MF-1]
MGRPKLMLYSLVIQQPDPLFKLHHPAIMLHTRNACLLHAARGVPAQDALARTPLWSTMMKVFLSRSGHQVPTGQWERFQTIIPVPSSIDLPTPPS